MGNEGRMAARRGAGEERGGKCPGALRETTEGRHKDKDYDEILRSVCVSNDY